MRVKFSEVVKDVKINVNRDDYDYYIAGDHMDSEDVHLNRRGKLSDGLTGSAFTRLFRAGQILYGSRRTYLKKCAVADFEGICANTTFVLESSDNDVFLNDLLPFVILSDSFTDHSIKKSRGSVNPYVLFTDIGEFEFDLPPIDEQRRLSEVLWAFDETKQAYKKLLAQTDELVKSQFVEMFGGGRFEDESIETFVDSDIEKVGQKYVATDEIRYIDISSIDNSRGEIVQYTDYEVAKAPSRAQQVVRQGDVLVSLVRPNLRNVAVVRDDYDNLIASTGFCVLRPTAQTRTEYLYAIVSSESFAGYLAGHAKGANYPAVNASDIKEYRIPNASLNLQTRFAAFAEAADKSKFYEQRSDHFQGGMSYAA